MLSQSPPSSIKTIPPSEHAALFAIINKARMLNGWTMRTAAELDPTIKTWYEALCFYRIPPAAYPELYRRCVDVRQGQLQTGRDAANIDAILLISQWSGLHGLKADLKQREIEDGRTLGTNAESVCQHCFGSGYKQIEQGGVRGVVQCDHS